MLRIGEYNELEVKRKVDFGLYLDSGDGTEILFPSKYIDEPVEPGDVMRVFVYTDSEDRLIATTEHPFATVGEFAYLQAVQVNRVGAFLDWGLIAKQLLVPFSEQTFRMREGGQYLVYVYLDDATKRVVASAKIDKFLGNQFPDYRLRDEVEALIIAHDEVGYRAIVDNKHKGMLYNNEVFRPLEIGEYVTAHVRNVRDDGKIDLTLNDRVKPRIMPVTDKILALIADAPSGVLHLTDHSAPEEIKAHLQCSKKDFKRAVGQLYKERKIRILPEDGGLTLA